MASKTLSLFVSLLLFIISAHGRTLQTGKRVDVSHAFSFATTYKGKTNYSDGGSWTTIKKTKSKAKTKTKTKTKTKKKKTKKNKKKKLTIILGTCIPSLIFCIAFGIYKYRHKAKVAAIAQASKKGPSDTKKSIPVEERPMNDLPNNVSSHNTPSVHN